MRDLVSLSYAALERELHEAIGSIICLNSGADISWQIDDSHLHQLSSAVRTARASASGVIGFCKSAASDAPSPRSRISSSV